ncbi:MAG: putative Ig domain-containing protein, partial [Magnetococcales bacterium]|nr:putative Ig domain-containing protein [Magnetococcales bacterium]
MLSPVDGRVALADAALFLDGEFFREGSALVIVGPWGERLRVADYFVSDPPPVLTAPNGAFLLPETVALLLPVEWGGVLVAGPTLMPEKTAGVAEGAAGVNSKTATASIGTVKEVSSTVTARSQGGESRVLKKGDAVFEGEELRTAEGGQLQLLFLDGTQFQVGASARVILDKFVYNPSAAQGEFAATVMKGAFGYASGDIARQHAGRHSLLKTPTAQIGIRGSALQGEVAEDGQTTVVHTSGVLDISNAQGEGTVTLLQPGTATVVTLDGTPQPVFQAPRAILERFQNILPPVPPDHQSVPSNEPSGESGRDPLSRSTMLDAYNALEKGAVLLGEDGRLLLSVANGIVGIDLAHMSQDALREFRHDLLEIQRLLPPAPAPTVALSHGVFLDSAVAGVHYRTATQEGITGQGGVFTFKAGETVTFSIGDIALGQAQMGSGASRSAIVTPTLLAATVAGSGQGASDRQRNVVSNMVRLLQTLDNDGDPDNGITITEAAQQKAVGAAVQGIDMTADTALFSANSQVASFVQEATQESPAPRTTLVDEQEALAHYEQTLQRVAFLESSLSVRSASFLSAVEDQPFTFALPPETFLSQTGSSLRYGVSALPGWLQFDEESLTLSGTPANGDVGNVTFTVTASSGTSASAAVNYVLMVNNVDDAPQATPIGAQSVRVGQAVQHLIAPFTDVDVDLNVGDSLLYDTLTYRATLADGQPLPDWLHFDGTTRTFTSALLEQGGQYLLRVTAEDSFHKTASSDFTLTVDTPPVLADPLPDQTANERQPFRLVLPETAFQDVDPWDTLSYAALLNGRALPDWLQFDAATRTFQGTPGNRDLGSFVVAVTATDRSGAAA